MKIVKRDGKIVNYDRHKIITAIKKANLEVNESERIEDAEIEEIVCYIEGLDKKRMLVEDIQDIIETKLMEKKKYELAKKYIVYRYTRALVRKKNAIDESILGLIKRQDDEHLDINPNKNAVLASTQRDLIAGEVSKDLTKRILLPPKISKAHEDGEIFFHDSDYFLQSIVASSYLDLSNMLDEGTVINNKLIETPKTFLVACLVTTQIIDTIACNQYGGVSIDISHLAKYLRKSYEKLEKEISSIINDEDSIKKLLVERLKYELSSGVQLIQYQLNTLMTTNGQCPDVSLFMNLDSTNEYETENVMLIEEILNQRVQGIKNVNGEYVAPRFPKLIYVLNEENNLNGGKYDYLTLKAIECSKKGGYPNYISSKVMKNLYKNSVFSPIGENSFLSPYVVNGETKYEGRFNIGVVTLNLPQIALTYSDNESKFWALLDDRLDLAKEALMCKYYALLGTLSNTSPLHWIYGGIARYQEGDFIDPLLQDGYATLSLGFIGLDETVKVMKKQGSDTPEGHEFALKILRRMKNTVDKWKNITGIGFQLYASENLEASYYFANIDKKNHGQIKGVTDKGYYHDSFTFDNEHMDMYSYLNQIKDFQTYCNGGCCYKIDIAKLNNDKNINNTINYLYDNIIYSEFATSHDKCKVCGYKGGMITSSKHSCQCPNCNNKDKTKFIIYRKLYE